MAQAITESGFKITEVISGDAKGVDKIGEMWAKVNNIPVTKFPAEWNNLKQAGAIIKTRQNPWKKKKEKYNANAGFYRNEEMAKYSDALIAIQVEGDTPGTQHMIKTAQKYNLKIFVYKKKDEDYEYQF